MNNKLKRATISLLLFCIIYISSGVTIGENNYNVYIKAIEFLSAVVGAGCYWIGSSSH